MKKLIFIGLTFLAFACKNKEQEPFGKQKEGSVTETSKATTQTPEELGKEIFEGIGNCTSCHQVDQKVIGPSIQEIAKIYKEKNGNIVAFLKDDAAPIVDPSQYEVMKTNFAITKAMSTEELQGLEAYIYSHLK